MEAVRRRFAHSTSSDDLAAFGLPAHLAKSFEEKPFEVWSENWKSFQLFVLLDTQWRVGMGGATGLDYNVLPIICNATNIKLSAQRLNDIRLMESEALKVMSEKRDEGKRNG